MKSLNNINIALAGNPNVGKSTLFNALTGMKQHTGNWPGKTVGSASGTFTYEEAAFTLVDLPGTYSLISTSDDEGIARDYICSGKADIVLAVADACCLERNLALVLQLKSVSDNLILCINLIDEAKKKKIYVDTDKLSALLGCPVISITAKSKHDVSRLKTFLYNYAHSDASAIFHRNTAVSKILTDATASGFSAMPPDTLKRILLESGPEHYISHASAIYNECVQTPFDEFTLNSCGQAAGISNKITRNVLNAKPNCTADSTNDASAGTLNEIADSTSRQTIGSALNDAEGIEADNMEISKLRGSANSITSTVHNASNADLRINIHKINIHHRDRMIDNIVTSRRCGFPIMLLLLALIFWITIIGANYPSKLLSAFFSSLEAPLKDFLSHIGIPGIVISMLIDGVYAMLSRVISVMLPPMAIFFPLFTLLEDFGYLPRIAFNMDSAFRCAGTCGKQCLTMMMGFGCNACGVTGCRIIESKREKLIAILTNSFVPCNGKFPTLIALITIFFAFNANPFFPAIILTLLVVFSVLMTLLTSKLLSSTVLKGMSSSFVLELPPYRIPRIGSVIVRSVLDRTLAVLGRAALAAAPAGLILWFLANYCITIHGCAASLLSVFTDFLNPFAQLLGIDGVILAAFILAFPANEMVVPIMLMAYAMNSSITDYSSLNELRLILISNGWTQTTAICTLLLSLFHFPCATTILTIKKETGSLKWTAASFLLPTALGLVLCICTNAVSALI